MGFPLFWALAALLSNQPIILVQDKNQQIFIEEESNALGFSNRAALTMTEIFSVVP